MALSIIHYDHPVLRAPTKKINCFDAKLHQLAEEMIETMNLHGGIGLAAPQIGQSIAMFVMDMRVAENPEQFKYTLNGQQASLEDIMPLVLINPAVQSEGPKTTYKEGCLSFPDIFGIRIERDSKLSLQFQDLQGRPHALSCDSFFARVILHEFDHLKGILFIDHMSQDQLAAIHKDLEELKKRQSGLRD